MHNMQIALRSPIAQTVETSASGSRKGPLHGAVALTAAVGHVLAVWRSVPIAAPGRQEAEADVTEERTVGDEAGAEDGGAGLELAPKIRGDDGIYVSDVSGVVPMPRPRHSLQVRSLLLRIVRVIMRIILAMHTLRVVSKDESRRKPGNTGLTSHP